MTLLFVCVLFCRDHLIIYMRVKRFKDTKAWDSGFLSLL